MSTKRGGGINVSEKPTIEEPKSEIIEEIIEEQSESIEETNEEIIEETELEITEETKEEVINKWEKSGLLEGLDGEIKENIDKIFESQQSFVVNESTKIDELPQNEIIGPRKKNISELSQSELRMYQKTGILPTW